MDKTRWTRPDVTCRCDFFADRGRFVRSGGRSRNCVWTKGEAAMAYSSYGSLIVGLRRYSGMTGRFHRRKLDICRWDFCLGDFCPGDFCPGDFCPGDFCPGDFCPGDFRQCDFRQCDFVAR
jgi:hypothetical protein